MKVSWRTESSFIKALAKHKTTANPPLPRTAAAIAYDGRPCLLQEPYVPVHAASSPCPHQHPRMWMDLVPRPALRRFDLLRRGEPFPEQNVTLKPLFGLSTAGVWPV